MASVRARLRISGSVQGVGYRWYCHQHATSLGLTGWVRNEVNRTVSAVVEGDRGLIESLIEVLRAGPPMASVNNIDVTWEEFTSAHSSFEITRAY